MDMKFKFFAFLLFCSLLLNKQNIVHMIYENLGLFAPNSLLKASLDYRSISSYLSSSILPYLSILTLLIIGFIRKIKNDYFSLLISLIFSATFYIGYTLYQWLPIINGNKMTSTFAIGSVLSVIYTNIIALISYYVVRYYNKRRY